MNSTEYQIFIGCIDSQTGTEIVDEKELVSMIESFFVKKQICFSIFDSKGGYMYENGKFVFENTLCISIIGEQGLDIIKLAKSLSMFMNQECTMIIRQSLQTEYK